MGEAKSERGRHSPHTPGSFPCPKLLVSQLLCPTATSLGDTVSLEAPQGFPSGWEPCCHRHRADSGVLAPCHNISLFNTETKGGEQRNRSGTPTQPCPTTPDGNK